jgi:Lsr2
MHVADLEPCLPPAIPQTSFPIILDWTQRVVRWSRGVGGRTWGVSLMRITFDTREDSYEDALGVLRRAYGRHVQVRRKEESSVPSVQVEPPRRGAATKSTSQSATGRGGKQAEHRTSSANGSREPVSERASATRAVVRESPAARSTTKKAQGRKAVARSAPPVKGRLGASQQQPAANTAPPGRSEAIRSWARAQGMQVSARGRMPAKVITAFLDAHKE